MSYDRGHGGELKRDFGADFASTAFQNIDDEIRIVGKYGQITQYESGLYDAWFVGPNLDPLSGLRINRICAACAQEERPVKKLTGEAFIRGSGREFVLRMAVLAGIKRKRQVSEETRQKLRERLAGMRSAAA